MRNLLRYIPILAVSLLYFYNLGLNQVWQPNEAFYADASKNMLRGGDFLTPIYNGEPRLNKPPMVYWLTALSFLLFGINELSLRFLQALAGLGTGFVTYFLAKDLSGERSALFSFLALTLSFQFIANARYTSPEVILCFFITLSIYLWYLSYRRESPGLFFLALTASSLGVLTKGPVGFLLPAGVIFLYLLFTDRRELLKIKYYLGTLYVLAAGGWWFLYQYMVNRESFLSVFIKENIKRIYALQNDPVYFYALDINISFLPYSFLFYIALIWVLKDRRKELTLPLVWFFVVFAAFSLVKMKIPVYIMPAFPAMAIITGEFLSNSPWKKTLAVSSLLLSILMIIAILITALTFELNVIVLLFCTILPMLFLVKRRFEYAPAVAGFSFLLYLSTVLLPAVERYRPYREIGERIKELDPEVRMKTYEIGAFHHNLPFYADRVILKDRHVEGEAMVLVRGDLLDCKAVGVWKMYTSSESRFLKFLKDIKRGRNFYDFKLCILGDER